MDDDYKLNVLSIRQGRPGWHSVITGAASTLTECAPTGDRTCPIYGAGSVKWRTNTKLVIVSKPVEIQLNNLHIIWSCCSYVTYQWSRNHQLLKACPPKPILEKNGRRCPGLPYLKSFLLMKIEELSLQKAMNNEHTRISCSWKRPVRSRWDSGPGPSLLRSSYTMRTKCAISDAFVRDCVFAYCASVAQYVYSLSAEHCFRLRNSAISDERVRYCALCTHSVAWPLQCGCEIRESA